MATNADKSEETRQALIQSAVDTITKKGYSKTSLEDIVKNIGMTRGAFYWHFKNKQDILKSIESYYEQQYLLDYGKFPVYESAYETLRSLALHQLADIFDDGRIAYAFIIRYRIEALTELPDLLSEQVAIDTLGVEQITKQVERGKEQGEFRRDVDAHTAALGLFTFIVGAENVRMLHREEDILCSLDRYVSIVDTYLNTLR